MIARQLSGKEVLTLPPTISLATLAQCLGVSEPTIRASHRSGELATLGIRVNRLGTQYRVVTATVLAYLGMADGACPVTARSNGAEQPKPSGPALQPVSESGERPSA
jgi:hypothetical protein